MLELCGFALALIKDNLKKQKEKNQEELILYLSIVKTKKLGTRVS